VTGIALTTAGLAGGAAPAMAATHSLGPPSYGPADAGYAAQGRWFRFVSTTLTVPPRVVSKDNDGSALIAISATCHGPCAPPDAYIFVAPGGGPGTVQYDGFLTAGSFRVSPQVGDRLTVSIYYDQHGHTYFTAADLTQHTTQTVRLKSGGISPVFNHAHLGVVAAGTVPPPAADTRLWDFTDSHLTTYTGVHGTVLGPWQTSQWIKTTDGTATGTVVTSPSDLSNGGQDFGVWLRALPLAYTDGLAGYGASSGRSFRFVSTTLTVPAATQPASAGDVAVIWLGQNGATPRAYAAIRVLAGGGAGSVSYGASYGPTTNAGTFAVTPKPGDRLSVSVYYDQQGHDYFTATDITSGTTQTAQVNADLAGTAYTTAVIGGEINNSVVTPPPADTQLWDFSGSHVTTYSGDKGTVLGPWATSEIADTINASASGAVVMSPSVLSNGGQNFGAWLRHH